MLRHRGHSPANRSTARLQHRIVLPTIVGEGFVRLSHSMHVLPLFDRRTGVVRGVEELSRKFFRHTLSAPRLGVLGDPPERKRQPADRANLDRNLVRGSSDPAGFDFHHRLDVVDRRPKDLQGITAGFLLDQIERSVADPFRGALLAARHQHIDEFADQLVPVPRIGQRFSVTMKRTSGHDFLCRPLSYSLPAFGFSFGPFRAVLRPPLLSIRDADRVERSAHDVIPYTRQILHPTAPDKHNGVFLQIVPDAGDIGCDLHAVRQANAGHLPKRRVRLLRRRGIHPEANPSLLRACLERRAFRFTLCQRSSLADKLINSRHREASPRHWRSHIDPSRPKPRDYNEGLLHCQDRRIQNVLTNAPHPSAPTRRPPARSLPALPPRSEVAFRAWR